MVERLLIRRVMTVTMSSSGEHAESVTICSIIDMQLDRS
jgi:hypothetical protein